uniref:hypothetical protein n=1 Tax=Pricia sp. TaxID=2268138 RepID=UPI003593A83F
KIIHYGDISLVDAIPSPWHLHETDRETIVQWSGNRSNPLTGNVLPGKLIPRGNSVYTYFEFEVSDFGGEFGSPNTITKRLNVHLTHYHPGVSSF